MAKKNKTVWGVVGLMLILAGAIYTVPFVIKGGAYLYGLPFTTIAVFGGLLLMVWAFSD